MTGFFKADQDRPVGSLLEEEAEAQIPRDRWDRPLIWPPGTGPQTHARRDMVPYARASSYGGQIEDKSALAQWGKRQMLRGAAIDLDRYAAEMALFREGRGPHPASPILDRVPQGLARVRGGEIESREKKVLDSLVDQADEAVGSSDKAALGTAIHLGTEIIDQGGDLSSQSPLIRERANAYYAKVKEWGIRWTSIELFGVEDENQVAGTWDRAGYIPWWSRWFQFIGDVKTSGSMDFAGIGFAVQLASYAHSCAYDIATGTRTPHENMNLEKALIIHVSREMYGPVEMFEVDIATGWQYAKLARQIVIARREGKKSIREIHELEVRIMSCITAAELRDLWEETGNVWTQKDRDLADATLAQIRATPA